MTTKKIRCKTYHSDWICRIDDGVEQDVVRTRGQLALTPRLARHVAVAITLWTIRRHVLLLGVTTLHYLQEGVGM